MGRHARVIIDDQLRQMDTRTHARTHGRTDRRTDRRKDVRDGGRAILAVYSRVRRGRTGARTHGRTRTDGRKPRQPSYFFNIAGGLADAKTDGRTDGRTEAAPD